LGGTGFDNESVVTAAEAKARELGLTVMTTTIDTGREHIGVEGHAASIHKLEHELAKAHWHAWPQARGSLRYTRRQDFSLYPPPGGIISGWRDITEEALREMPAQAPETFSYRGGGSFLISGIVSAFCLAALIALGRPVDHIPLPLRLLIAAAVFTIGACLEYFSRWFSVTVDDKGFHLTRRLFQEPRDIGFGEIRDATILVAGAMGERLFSLNLKSGESVELPLPEVCHPGLLALVRAKVKGQQDPPL
jgi:hypothetical protein